MLASTTAKNAQMAEVRIELNGTDTNPWHKFGLTQNPFPQLARMETDRYVLRWQGLGGDPIPDADYIRSHLKGYATQELIELCVASFRKGTLVKFIITWPDE